MLCNIMFLNYAPFAISHDNKGKDVFWRRVFKILFRHALYIAVSFMENNYNI